MRACGASAARRSGAPPAAARGGDVEAVRGHIASGTLLNGPDETNPMKQTPLHCAVESGHKAVAELLLANGAGINAKRADGLTALDIVLKADPEASDEDRAVRKAIAGAFLARLCRGARAGDLAEQSLAPIDRGAFEQVPAGHLLAQVLERSHLPPEQLPGQSPARAPLHLLSLAPVHPCYRFPS